MEVEKFKRLVLYSKGTPHPESAQLLVSVITCMCIYMYAHMYMLLGFKISSLFCSFIFILVDWSQAQIVAS